MCGIAGIIYSDGGGEHQIGRDMTRDAAVDEAPRARLDRLRALPARVRGLRDARQAGGRQQPRDFDFDERLRAPARRGRAPPEGGRARAHAIDATTEHAMTVTFDYDGDLKQLADHVEDVRDAEVLSLGRSLEIIKDLGDAETVAADYKLDSFGGTHAIGHARMATESDVDISGAHPYWAYPFSDVAVVHNGQLTNYHQWRRRLERAGHRFQCECDSEIIAVYLAERMAQGDSLEDVDAAQPRRARRRLHVPVRHRGRARVAKDELGRQAARALRVRRHRGAGVRGDRDPRRRRPRDRDVRPLRGGGDGVDE